MYLMFVDESGDTGITNSPTRYFVLSGLVIHESRWSDALQKLQLFRQEMRTRFGLKIREEIHASEMFNKPGQLARIPKHERLEIIRRFADTLAALQPDISLVSVVVDKSLKAGNYDIFYNAWQALIQRFENTIGYRNFPGRFENQSGMLLCDHTDDKKLTTLVRKMRVYNPIPNQPWAGNGYRNIHMKNVIEDPVFRDSKYSLFIQASDTCAYLLQQNLNPSKYMKKKGGCNYFSRMQPICCRHASPKDPNGIVRL